MDSTDLTPEQAARLRAAIARQLAYLGKLRQRMERVGFPPNDSLYRAVARAFDAMQEVHVRAHYAACTSGVGKAVAVKPAARTPNSD